MRVKRKATDNQQIKAHALDRLFGGFLDLLRPDRAVFWSHGHRDPLNVARIVGVAARAMKPYASERFQGVEFQPLIFDGVLDARLGSVQDTCKKLSLRIKVEV